MENKLLFTLINDNREVIVLLENLGLNKLSRPHSFLEREALIKYVLQLIINELFPEKWMIFSPISREARNG